MHLASLSVDRSPPGTARRLAGVTYVWDAGSIFVFDVDSLRVEWLRRGLPPLRTHLHRWPRRWRSAQHRDRVAPEPRPGGHRRDRSALPRGAYAVGVRVDTVEFTIGISKALNSASVEHRGHHGSPSCLKGFTDSLCLQSQRIEVVASIAGIGKRRCMRQEPRLSARHRDPAVGRLLEVTRENLAAGLCLFGRACRQKRGRPESSGPWSPERISSSGAGKKATRAFLVRARFHQNSPRFEVDNARRLVSGDVPKVWIDLNGAVAVYGLHPVHFEPGEVSPSTTHNRVDLVLRIDSIPRGASLKIEQIEEVDGKNRDRLVRIVYVPIGEL